MADLFPLERLPVKLQSLVLHHVGQEFFEDDLRRLTLSKHWFELALPILSRRLVIAAETFSDHILLGDTLDAFPRRPYVQELVLDLDFSSWYRDLIQELKDFHIVPENSRTIDVMCTREHWRLTSTASPWPNLKRAYISFRCRHPRVHCFILPTIEMISHFMSQTNASISFDLSLCRYKSGEPSKDILQARRVLIDIIPRLQSLSLQHSFWCGAIFEIPPPSPDSRPDDGLVELKELQLILGAATDDMYRLTDKYGEQSAVTRSKWIEALCDSTSALTKRMTEPRTVRVYWKDEAYRRSSSCFEFDAVTGTMVSDAELLGQRSGE